MAHYQSALKLLKNPLMSMRSKHIDVAEVQVPSCHTLRIRTDEMLADRFTKPDG